MRFFAACFSATLISISILAADTPEFPVIYNSQGETVPLFKPEEALKRMKLPPGFKATLFAAELDRSRNCRWCPMDSWRTFRSGN
jgi:hypothetical protein